MNKFVDTNGSHLVRAVSSMSSLTHSDIFAHSCCEFCVRDLARKVCTHISGDITVDHEDCKCGNL